MGKEHHDHPSGPSLPPPLPSLSCMPVPVPAASHAKTGSKDSSTQTDKTAELFWPATASFPGRGRLGATSSHSPAPRPLGTRVASEKLGELCQIPPQCKMSAIPRDTSVSVGTRCGDVMLPQFVKYNGGFFRETKIGERELSKAAQSGFVLGSFCKAQFLCGRENLQLFMLPDIKW